MFSRHKSEPQEPLTEFFQQLNAPLQAMPVQDRAELHTEMRQHLDALVAAHQELGASSEEALRAAIQQFGDPGKTGKNLFREWRRTGRRPSEMRQSPETLAKAIWHMIGCKGLMLGLSAAAGIPLTEHGTGPVLTCYLVCFLAPLLAGIMTGWKMPEKAAPGAFYAGLFFMFPFMIMMFQSEHALSGLVIALDWLAVSYVGAYAASAQRRGGFYRVHLSDFRLRRH
jgi:hypothetical protein